MKNENETLNFWLICIVYFIIGLIFVGNYYHDRAIKSMQDSINTLIKIELITEHQFNLLHDKVKALENHESRRIATIRE